jgi:hypothetical protein
LRLIWDDDEDEEEDEEAGIIPPIMGIPAEMPPGTAAP